ncbi:MAG: DNA-binding protein WhiA [Chitinophagales bacterium]
MGGVAGTFSSETRNELARLMPEKRCCQAAELSALVRLNGGLELAGKNNMGISIVTENASVARKCFKLFKSLFEMPVTVIMESKKRFNTSKIYQVNAHLDRQHLEVLRQLGMMDEENHLLFGINSQLVKNRCCKRAYLRGTFLARGSINKPESSYHMEIVFPGDEVSGAVVKMAQGLGINFHSTHRKGTEVLYLKESEQIVDFLRMTGAANALLEFENVRVIKSVKNQVNRTVNCETANLEKTVEASMRQVGLINLMVNRVGFEGIPEKFRDLAILRLEYPDRSLKELGELMDPPLSKSAVAYRMRGLEKLTDNYCKISTK